MSAISYLDVFELYQDENHAEAVEPGDIVLTGQNKYPRFTVIAVNGEKAWLRNVQSGADCLTPLCRCRKVQAA